jgi:hypothetical protein
MKKIFPLLDIASRIPVTSNIGDSITIKNKEIKKSRPGFMESGYIIEK